MKSTCIFAVFALMTQLSFAQNGSQTKPVSTQSNGVVVHQSAGNEGFVQPVAPESKSRTIDDWTLPECIDALGVIERKMSKLGNSDEDLTRKVGYEASRTRIEQRKQELMAQQH